MAVNVLMSIERRIKEATERQIKEEGPFISAYAEAEFQRSLTEYLLANALYMIDAKYGEDVMEEFMGTLAINQVHSS